MWSRTPLVLGVVIALGPLAACSWVPRDDVPPAEVPTTADTPESSVPTSRNPVRTGRPSTAPTPTPTGFPETSAVPCAGRPTGDQVIAVVRGQGSLLPSGASVRVQTGPLCAGSWQYTVLQIPDHEPLQVVTKQAPTALTFVTAGTNVCTVDVRANAPVGLQRAATC